MTSDTLVRLNTSSCNGCVCRCKSTLLNVGKEWVGVLLPQLSIVLLDSCPWHRTCFCFRS
jgi:hypothetical protein